MPPVAPPTVAGAPAIWWAGSALPGCNLSRGAGGARCGPWRLTPAPRPEGERHPGEPHGHREDAVPALQHAGLAGAPARRHLRPKDRREGPRGAVPRPPLVVLGECCLSGRCRRSAPVPSSPRGAGTGGRGGAGGALEPGEQAVLWLPRHISPSRLQPWVRGLGCTGTPQMPPSRSGSRVGRPALGHLRG